MRTEPFDVILFDLGGVLIELTGVPAMIEWTKGRFTEDQLWERWLSSPAVRKFERGQSTPQQFSGTMIAEFDLDVSADMFLSEFLYWPRRTYPGTKTLLENLASRYTLASLSNISALHWERICNEMELTALFNSNFPSFETGYVKPDREAYQNALEKLKCRPERVLFMDDNAANVNTAVSMGMTAFTVAGLSGVKSVLKMANIC
jgi:HAD superfamily hydrolase (TIGR01509 family)